MAGKPKPRDYRRRSTNLQIKLTRERWQALDAQAQRCGFAELPSFVRALLHGLCEDEAQRLMARRRERDAAMKEMNRRSEAKLAKDASAARARRFDVVE